MVDNTDLADFIEKYTAEIYGVFFALCAISATFWSHGHLDWIVLVAVGALAIGCFWLGHYCRKKNKEKASGKH